MSFLDYSSNVKKDRTGQYLGELKTGQSNALAELNNAKSAQDNAVNSTVAQNKPWISAGQTALQKYQSADYNPQAFDFSHLDFYNDPSFQFRLQQGVNALDRSAAARGKVLSGQQQQAIAQYGQNLASQEYANAFARALQANQVNNAYTRQKYLDTLGQQGQLMGYGYNAGQSNIGAFGRYGNALANLYGTRAGMQYGYGKDRVNTISGELARQQNMDEARLNRNYGLIMAPIGVMGGGANALTGILSKG